MHPMGDYETEKKRLTTRVAIVTNVEAVVFIVAFLTRRVNVMTLMVLLLVALIVTIAWFFVQMTALGKRHGKW
jgi:hypothetical protein